MSHLRSNSTRKDLTANRGTLRGLSILLCALAACSRATGPGPVTTPAAKGSGQPSLTASKGKLYLSWLERGEGTASLRFAVLAGGSWSGPATIASGSDLFVSDADVPSVLPLSDGSIAAHWPVRGSDREGYETVVSLSHDGGRTWSPAARPYAGERPGEHAFATLVEDSRGKLKVVWLDGGRAETELHAAQWNGTAFDTETVLDRRVCDCCRTAALSVGADLLLAYRDRDVDDVRDISVRRKPGNGRWTVPIPVHGDGWKIAGCPVNGPALATDGWRLGIAWFTAAGGGAKVLASISGTPAAAFDEPVRLDGGAPLGRVGAAAVPNGFLVSWLEGAEGAARVEVRLVGWDGTLSASRDVSTERVSGLPAIAVVGDDAYVAWTSPGPPSEIHLVRIGVGSFGDGPR